MKKIPLVDLKVQYNRLKSAIDEAMAKVIDNTSFIMGEAVTDFEREFGEFNGSRFALGLANGTEGLHLALRAMGIGQGDEVITCPTTFMATVEAICYTGAKPVFVDCEEETANIDPAKIEKAITSRTRAIIPVHMYGLPCKMRKIMEIAKKHNLQVLEDCSHAHGAEYDGKKVGNFGLAGIFSLFPAKILGAFGDAAVLTTNDEDFYEKMKLLRDHGRPSKHEHSIIGYNCRLDTLQAAILSAKMPHLGSWVKARQRIAAFYNQKLADFVKVPEDLSSAFYMYVIQTPDRDALMKYLGEQGIACGIHYPTPLHLQDACVFLGYKKGDFPHAENWAESILSLPLFPELSEDQMDYVASQVRSFFKERGHRAISGPKGTPHFVKNVSKVA